MYVYVMYVYMYVCMYVNFITDLHLAPAPTNPRFHFSNQIYATLPNATQCLLLETEQNAALTIWIFFRLFLFVSLFYREM